MKELQPNIATDFEHRVNRTIELHQNDRGFPNMAAYHLTREELDSYLFDYQAALDSEGTAKQQQTIYSIIALIPILVLSAFPLSSLPWESDSISVVVGIAIGGGIALSIKGIRTLITRSRLKTIREAYPDIAEYIKAVLSFEE